MRLISASHWQRQIHLRCKHCNPAKPSENISLNVQCQVLFQFFNKSGLFSIITACTHSLFHLGWVKYKGHMCNVTTLKRGPITSVTLSFALHSSYYPELRRIFTPFYFLSISHHYAWRTGSLPISSVKCPYTITRVMGSSQMGHLSPWPPGGRWKNTASCQSLLESREGVEGMGWEK